MARLYYDDAYLDRFSARVVERVTWENHPAVVLDRTAFYPTAGGQPADRGSLNGVAVVDVVLRERDDAILHVLARALPESDGSAVEGQIDWPRRFDHMQQHTGQHVLSAAFEQVLDADTVGFHLGSQTSTVDIDAPRLDGERALEVERLSNRIVWQDHAVDVRFVDQEALASLPLRRPPTVEGPIRIVSIGDFDVNPCGGTHVSRTGETGLIRISSLDYRGDVTRVTFLCGGRALRDYRDKDGVIDRLTARLTVGYWELDQAVERLQDENKHLHKALRQARERLLAVAAEDLIAQAVPCGPYRAVLRVWQEGKPAADLRGLALALRSHTDVIALLASIDEGTNVCFACADDVPADAAALLKKVLHPLGGKGGGQPHLAQGGAPPTDPARVEALLSDTLSDLMETIAA